jgi:hypothetical protein
MKSTLTDRHNRDGIREEVVRQGAEHVPFMAVILCQAIEDCRRAIVNAEDGGLSALDGLWTVLPTDIRAIFKDLPGEIVYQGRVRYYATSHLTRKKMTFGGGQAVLEYDPKTGKIEERRTEPKTYNVPHKRITTWHVENVTPKQVRRQFVMEWFTKIMDVLESKGLLQQTRIELLGNED